MNAMSITDYILKLEKLNDESRTKIEQLKTLLQEAHDERVSALEKLSLYDTTSRVTDKTIKVVNDKNTDITEYLLTLAECVDEYFKTVAYRRAAEVVADLPYEVLSGESLLHLNGIGKSIASKIDDFLEDRDSDYEESIASTESDAESVASNDCDSDGEESDDYYISYNHDIYTMLMNVAGSEKDGYKRQAYVRAASKIYNLPYKITNGKEAMKLQGIGKSIASKIDDFFHENRNCDLVDCFIKLGNLEDDHYKSEAYWNAEEKLRDLNFEVTSSDQVKKIKGFGPSICAKIDEFFKTGTMKRIEELSRT
jgi:DNA polymerase/3'-5' exonuclease PolX